MLTKLRSRLGLAFCLLWSSFAYTQTSLWLETATYTVANVADGITTVSCPTCTEYGSPYLYGTHPTARSYFLPAFGIEAAQVFVAWKLGRSRHKVLRFVGHAQLWAGCGAHATGFVLNLNR